MLEIQLHLLKQCSQPSGCPVGPWGGTSKGPGLDRTATCSPRAVKARDGCPWPDGRPYRVRHVCSGWGIMEDGRGRPGVVRNGRGLEDCGG